MPKRAPAIVLVALASLAAPMVAQAQTQAPQGRTKAAEREARGQAGAKAFLDGRYEEALAIYVDLYVQSEGRVEYLRNIARCRHKLRHFDRAIEVYKDYLLRAKLSPAERDEIRGFIAEAEGERNRGAAAPAPAAPAPADPQASAGGPPAVAGATVPAPVAPTAAGATPVAAPPVTAAPAAPPPGSAAPPPAPVASTPPLAPPAVFPPPQPQYVAPPPAAVRVGAGDGGAGGKSNLRVAGVVTLIGAAVAALGGTAMLISARSSFDDGKKQGCPNGSDDCETRADSVGRANLISQLLFVGAGVAAAGGVTMILLAPTPEAGGGTRVSFGVRLTF